MSDHVEVLQSMLSEEASRLSLQNYERAAINAAIDSLRQVPEGDAWKVSTFDRWNSYAKELGYVGLLEAMGYVPPRCIANPAPPMDGSGDSR